MRSSRMVLDAKVKIMRVRAAGLGPAKDERWALIQGLEIREVR